MGFGNSIGVFFQWLVLFHRFYHLIKVLDSDKVFESLEISLLILSSTVSSGIGSFDFSISESLLGSVLISVSEIFGDATLISLSW